MNKVIYNYIIKNYLKIVLNMTLVFFGVIILLNLFQEIEFFKDLNVGIQLPLTLTIMLAPNIIIKIFPFIIFFSAMWYLVSINNNKELLTLKFFGISNLKMISILSIVTFLIGVMILITINPFTSSMIKYYEQTKSTYSKDTDHLVSINKNGVWIKEKSDEKLKLMYAKNLENNNLNKLSIYIFDTSNKNLKRIEVDKADITSNSWVLSNVKIYNNDNNLPEKKEVMIFNSMFNLSKIKSAYKNLDTISFVRLLKDQEKLLGDGYSKSVIQEKINSYFSLPIFLVLMVFLASIFGLETRNKVNNTYFVFVSIITCVLIYYFKDLSIALGQTNKISIILSVWMPLIAVTLFCSIGLLRLYEK